MSTGHVKYDTDLRTLAFVIACLITLRYCVVHVFTRLRTWSSGLQPAWKGRKEASVSVESHEERRAVYAGTSNAPKPPRHLYSHVHTPYSRNVLSHGVVLGQALDLVPAQRTASRSLSHLMKMVTSNNILRWPLRDSVCDTVTDKKLDNTPPRDPYLTNCCLHSLPYQASHLALPVKSSMPGRAGQQHGRWQSQRADGQAGVRGC